MWLSEKNAIANRKALAKPTARRSPRSMQPRAYGKAEPTFYVVPPVFKYEPGKTTLVKGK